MMNLDEFISHACKCLTKGKPGTFGLMRDSAGQLWYLSRGTQSKVLSLDLEYPGCFMNEDNFHGVLIVRSKTDKDVPWYVLLESVDSTKVHSCIISSMDKEHFFSCSIVADAPKIQGSAVEPIAALIRFNRDGNAVVRFNDLQLARALVMDAHEKREASQIMDNTSIVAASSDDFNQIDQSTPYWEECHYAHS